VTGEADNGAAGCDLAHMFGCAIAVVAVNAGQDGAGIECYLVVLGGVWVKRVNDGVTELAVAGASAGAAFQDAGAGGMAEVTVILMDIDQETRLGVTACSTGYRLGKRSMGRGEMVGIVCASGLVAVDTITVTNRRVAIGPGDQSAGDGGVAGVTPPVGMDAVSPIRFVMAGDTGGGDQDV